MSIAADVEVERAQVAQSLSTVGPSAATACGSWTAMDLAAHLVSAERVGGVLTFVGRSLVARGVRTRTRAEVTERVIRHERRHGFDALVDRLRRPSPRLLLRPRVVGLALFEVWMHHDDITAANGLVHDVPAHLVDVLPWLLRYQAGRLPAGVQLSVCIDDGRQWRVGPADQPLVTVNGTPDDLVRWLAGRSTITTLTMTGPEQAVAEIRDFTGNL